MVIVMPKLKLCRENIDDVLSRSVPIRTLTNELRMQLVVIAHENNNHNCILGAKHIGINRGVFRNAVKSSRQKLNLHLDQDNLREIIAGDAGEIFNELKAQLEQALFDHALVRCYGNISAVARKLKCSRTKCYLLLQSGGHCVKKL